MGGVDVELARVPVGAGCGPSRCCETCRNITREPKKMSANASWSIFSITYQLQVVFGAALPMQYSQPQSLGLARENSSATGDAEVLCASELAPG